MCGPGDAVLGAYMWLLDCANGENYFPGEDLVSSANPYFFRLLGNAIMQSKRVAKTTFSRIWRRCQPAFSTATSCDPFEQRGLPLPRFRVEELRRHLHKSWTYIEAEDEDRTPTALIRRVRVPSLEVGAKSFQTIFNIAQNRMILLDMVFIDW
jgi:hypothetical protein